MSLSVAGVWAVDVWDQTVWADGVWREGVIEPDQATDRHTVTVEANNTGIVVSANIKTVVVN